MRAYFTLIFLMLFTAGTIAQATYGSVNFAGNGDTFYLTRATPGNLNFEATGTDMTWDYGALAGVSQKRLIFRQPMQAGFTLFQWPYIYNSANTNLSATDEQTVAVLNLQQTNPNDFYLKSAGYLLQKAASYTASVNDFSFNVKNVYTRPDTIYKFPFTYNSISESHASYTIVLPPDLYYRNARINRNDTVNGWGKVITPFATYNNCIRYVSTITQIDTISLNGVPAITNDTIVYREIKWFDPSEKFPVLSVRQTKTGNQFVTQSVEYTDTVQQYQPAALFAYLPLAPKMGDTVIFQNLSTNGYSYKWNFGNPTTGPDDSSAKVNPTHIFDSAGTYLVQLIAYNGNLTDTFSLSVSVSPVNMTYTFTGNGFWSDPNNWSNKRIPPAILPATNSIVINPVSRGQCLLNIIQRIEPGASLTVNTGKILVLPGSLNIQ